MNRSLEMIFVLSVGVAVPSVVDAQMASSPVTVSIAAGVAMPMGDMGDFGKTGYNLGGGVELGSSTFPFGLRAELGYSHFGKKEYSFTDPVLGTFTSETKLGNLNVNLSAVLAPKLPTVPVRPYAIGGVGFYRSSSDVTFTGGGETISGDDSKASFGLNGGAGIRFHLVRFSSFVEARYHYVFKGVPDAESDNDSWKGAGYLPIVFGITIGG